MKGDPMDLRLDIERRKKYSMHEKVPADSQDFGQERSEGNFPKHCKISKKSVRKRSRSSSSSSSSSSNSHKDEGAVHGNFKSKNEIFSRAQLGQKEPPVTKEGARPQEEFKIQIQRSWNKSSHQGNKSPSDQVNMAINTKGENWDPRFSPRSKAYFLHDDRDNDTTWKENQGQSRGGFPLGRTRFIIRKATGNASSSKNQDHKAEEINGQTT